MHFLYEESLDRPKIAQTADRAPNDVPVGSDRYVGVDPLLLHDILQLSSDFPSFTKQFWVQEVFHRPVVSIAEP